MKALLLAAGFGKRLNPLTDEIPKCLVPINNIPLIEYWFTLFRKYKIDEILINAHHLSENVINYINQHVHDLKIKIEYEPELLGSLGSLLKYLPFFSNEKYLLTFYADNLTNLNLNKFVLFHNSHSLPVSIGLYKCADPSQRGIATLDEDRIVVDFVEKPTNSNSYLANAGIYAFDLEIFTKIEQNNKRVLDIGYDLLPLLIGQMKAFLIDDYIIDIGTIQNYKKANKHLTLNPNLFK